MGKNLKVVLVCGARPNFMKVAPLLRVMRKFNQEHGNYFEPIVVHTGQHYDYEMSKVFFEDLELPSPDIYLGVGSGTHAEQTGKIMIQFERLLFREQPYLVMVVGDVNSTLAASLTAVKLQTPIAHVEAGLRSFDKTMPEEINRLLTDAISDYLFIPSLDASENLKREGIDESKIFFVGNVMVDSLLLYKEKASGSNILSSLNLTRGAYAVLTLHRPENVDSKENLLGILEAVKMLSTRIPVVFPVHPRTRKNIAQFGFIDSFREKHIYFSDPLGYLDFFKLEMEATFVMTDSGGIQEETTVLSVPCLTLRKATERPITVTQGTNILVGNDAERIIKEGFRILNGKAKKGTCPPLWDGKTADRIVEILIKYN